jgi:hypothetical protein
VGSWSGLLFGVGLEVSGPPAGDGAGDPLGTGREPVLEGSAPGGLEVEMEDGDGTTGWTESGETELAWV